VEIYYVHLSIKHNLSHIHFLFKMTLTLTGIIIGFTFQ